MSWSVDRLGRSLQQLVGFLGDIHEKGIDLYLHQQGLDTSTPSGKALFQMLGVFAEFERAMIQERVKAGLAHARAQDPVFRPVSSIASDRPAKKGMGIKRIANHVGIGVGTVQRILAQG
ncbi:MAG: recombinase family protein [Gammaproteobacteria bacterium]|nr:recombinase family protein [Gammaproteobacteria bacterium]